MDTRYIKEFVALAENGNYWQTSYDLYMSQSSLSKHIMTLERELGFSLFHRTTRSVKLTSDGEIFYSYAVKISQLLEEYDAVCESHRKAEENAISIASTSQMVHYSAITDALAHFKRQHLNCALDIVTEPHRNLKKLLLQGNVDFIWIGEPAEEIAEQDFVRVPFIEEPLVAIFPKDKFAQKTASISLGDLADHELIIQDNSSIEQSVFLNFCKQSDIVPKISSIPGASIMDFVSHGLGIAVMLRSVAETAAFPGMVIADIDDSPIVSVSLLYLKNANLSPAALSFLSYLKGE